MDNARRAITAGNNPGRTATMTHAAPLWTPSPERVAETALRRFMDFLGERVGRRFADYADIHAFSIAEREAFWSALWDFCGVNGEKGERVLVDDRMPGARFFPDARLNFAENLLRCNGASEAMVFRGEDGSS